MSTEWTRRGFLRGIPVGIAATWTIGPLGVAAASDDATSTSDDAVPTTSLPEHFPAQDPALVSEVVGASHGRLERVRELVTRQPSLAKASWDWGFGDWETALGAASHVGNRAIAELLIEHGARPDLFTHAMLGHTDVVRAAVEAQPGIQSILGPHGITLLQHARAGRADAAETVRYLESVGGADAGATSLEITDDEKAALHGRYTFGPGDTDWFHVTKHSRGMLMFSRAEGTPRTLHRVEPHGFAPAGAPAVRIRFRMQDDRAVAVTVHDPDPVVTATRTND